MAEKSRMAEKPRPQNLQNTTSKARDSKSLNYTNAFSQNVLYAALIQ